MERKTVVVAMSGGVDSSVAAALLVEAGYDVIGVTMRLWDGEGGLAFSKTCCSLDSIEDARRVCQVLGIPFYPLNMTREFQQNVIDYFCQEYQVGRTPNPCLACNRFVKFSFLLGRARALGADYLATGHYARIELRDGRRRLLRGLDPGKDQSYVLYTLGQEELRYLLFPIGNYRKTEVRRLAQKWALPIAGKPESQDVCFITEGDYRDFLAGRVPSSAGPVLDREGRRLGTHRGLPFYTVGQRRGLGLALGRPYFVIGLDEPRNAVIVGTQEELESPALLAGDVTFVSGRPPREAVRVEAQIRYRTRAVPATLSAVPRTVRGATEDENPGWERRHPAGHSPGSCQRGAGETPALPGGHCEEATRMPENGFRVDFAQPQRAVTPGQAVVFYEGEEVLGGGTIEASLRP